jgi:hypothetical protein
VNWNILVTVGKEINRDSRSSGERNWTSLLIYILTEYFGISNPKKVIALYVENKFD